LSKTLVGINDWNGVKFRLIEEAALEDTQYLPQIIYSIKITDIFAILIDLCKNLLIQMNKILNIFKNYCIF